MKAKISIVTLGVADLQVSKTFYEVGLGLMPRPESQDSITFYEMGGTWLALFPTTELKKDIGTNDVAMPPAAITLAHNEPSRARVDEVIEEARAARATILKEPQEVFWGGYSGYFADPDGHIWEVAHNPFMD